MSLISNLNDSKKESRTSLLSDIISKVHIFDKDTERVIFDPRTGEAMNSFFDFRKGFSNRDFLEKTTEIFWSHFDKTKPWQIGGLESASLPLITALVMTSENATGFFIRKSRKKKGQTRLIEGEMSDTNIILVDDLINSGSSLQKAALTLEEEGFKVSNVFTIIQYFEDEFYDFFKEREVGISSIFSLSEFDSPNPTPPPKDNFEVSWYFGPSGAHHIVPGSRNKPFYDSNEKVFFTTSDSGNIWKVDRQTGDVSKKLRLSPPAKLNKSTLTNCISKEKETYVGTWSGKIVKTNNKLSIFSLRSYQLGDSIDGNIKEYSDGLLCTVLHGKRAFLTYFDTSKKEVIWQHQTDSTVRELLIDEKEAVVYFGTKEGKIAKLTKDGSVCWERNTNHSFTAGLVFADESKSTIIAIDVKGHIVMLDEKTGRTKSDSEFPQFVYATPTVKEGQLFASSLDRSVCCYDLTSKKILWETPLHGRSYASPVVHENSVFIGDNSGILLQIDSESGSRKAKHQVVERINNPVQLIDNELFLSTSAGELYSLKNKILTKKKKLPPPTNQS